jgi:hypothetical protein
VITTQLHEPDDIALSLYKQGSVDPTRDPGAINLALALNMRVRLVPSLPVRALVHPGEPVVIELRRQLAPAGREYDCGHEMGHVANDCLACGDPRLETHCDRIAVSIVAPRPAMYLLRAVFGYDVTKIAATLETSELIVALRWGVVFEESVAVVLDRGGVRRSGSQIALGDLELRRIAKGGGSTNFRAVRLARGVMLIGVD